MLSDQSSTPSQSLARPSPDRFDPPGEAEGASAAPTARWLICRAKDFLCALPIGQVIETMRMPSVEIVADVPRHVRGLCRIRGAAVPVVDLAVLISGEPSMCERLVTIDLGGRAVALAVASIIGIRDIAADAGEELPPLLRGTERETVATIGTADAEFLFFLCTARMLPEELLSRLCSNGDES